MACRPRRWACEMQQVSGGATATRMLTSTPTQLNSEASFSLVIGPILPASALGTTTRWQQDDIEAPTVSTHQKPQWDGTCGLVRRRWRPALPLHRIASPTSHRPPAISHQPSATSSPRLGSPISSNESICEPEKDMDATGTTRARGHHRARNIPARQHASGERRQRPNGQSRRPFRVPLSTLRRCTTLQITSLAVLSDTPARQS